MHLATGHEISLAEDGEITLAKEYKPTFAFTDIKKSNYIEPLLHHGYGFDTFIVK